MVFAELWLLARANNFARANELANNASHTTHGARQPKAARKVAVVCAHLRLATQVRDTQLLAHGDCDFVVRQHYPSLSTGRASIARPEP